MKQVYFIKPVDFTGPIKIGCSAGPVRRMEQLRLWSPFPLEIVATIEGDLGIERRFHALFFDDHQSREWFRVTPRMEAVIAQINAGTFDVSTLPEPRVLSKHRSPGPGKWSEERKASARLDNAVRRAEKASGLVPDYSASAAERAAFAANPESVGITREERWRRAKLRTAAHYRAQADEIAAEFTRPTEAVAA